MASCGLDPALAAPDHWPVKGRQLPEDSATLADIGISSVCHVSEMDFCLRTKDSGAC